jgi:hypothetical protein
VALSDQLISETFEHFLQFGYKSRNAFPIGFLTQAQRHTEPELRIELGERASLSANPEH